MKSAMRLRREAVGITQVALAAQLGVSQPFVSEIESGHKVPGPMLAASIAGALNTSVESLWSKDSIANVPTFYKQDTKHPVRLAMRAAQPTLAAPKSDPIRDAVGRSLSREGSALDRTSAAIAALRKIEDLLVFAEVSQ